MIFTFVIPVVLGDPVKWRDLLGLVNLHTQYNVPLRPMYPWDIWENYDRRSFDKEDYENTVDDSRTFVYEFFRKFMDQKGVNGEACMHRAFCDNAQVYHHEGLYSEILGAILTPGKVQDPFQDSYDAGKAGVNCEAMFKECPRGDSLFDQITVDVS